MEISFSSSFKRSLKKRIKNKPGLEKKFWTKIKIFIDNPFEPSLKTHRLSGKLKDCWSFSVEYDVRIIYFYSDKNKVVFIAIGSHKEVY